LEAAEIEDGVADELAGAVVGDVPAAVDFVKGDTAAQEELIGGEDVGAAGVAAEGENRGVFEEEEGVLDVTGQAQGRDLCLNAEGFVVGNAAEVEVLDHATSLYGLGVDQRWGAGSKMPAKFARTRRKTRSQRRLTTAAMGRPDGAMVMWVRSMLMIIPASTVSANGT